MTPPEEFYKKKAIRFFLMAYIFFAFAIFGIGSSLTSMYLQKTHRAELVDILADENTSGLDLFFYEMTSSKQRTFLALGVIFGIMSGFCFAAANSQKKHIL